MSTIKQLTFNSIKLAVFTAIALSYSALSAQTSTTHTQQQATAYHAPADTNLSDKPIFDQCPQPSELVKDSKTMQWSAKGHLDGTKFQSFDKSFTNTVDHFIGAQWVGVKVGQIICLYQPSNSNEFPVQLVFNTLTYAPTGKHWSKDLGGHENCVSVNPEDCQYQLKPAEKKTDPYKAALGLKDSAKNLQPY